MTIANAAVLVVELDKIIEELGERRERHAHKLEKAAHAWCERNHKYARSGQYPHLESVIDASQEAEFSVTNGRDHGDDFSFRLGLDVLAFGAEWFGAK